jgi:hypothetical protein
MSHFAKIENDIVVQVIVAEQDFINTLDGEWIQTSYNTRSGEHLLGGTPLRKNYAGIGYIYDRERDAFYSPQPFPSWLFNEDKCIWVSPIPKPEVDDYLYYWSEEELNWIKY